MLPSKIELTDILIDSIKTARITKRIPAATLSKAIRRDASYISSLELGRLRNISTVDLVLIHCIIYNISEHEAITMVEALINEGRGADIYHGHKALRSLVSDGKGAIMAGEPYVEYHVHNEGADFAEPELISDMLDTLTSLIIDIYKENPKEAVYMLTSIIKSMQFDPEFTMGIMGIPFFALKHLGANERKEVLNELLDVFKKHADKANA